MFLFSDIFWIILSLGIAIPSTGVLIINIITKISAGDSYQISLGGLFTVYLIALVGWSIFITEVVK